MKTSIIVLALGLLTASYFIMTPSVDSVETEFQQFLGEYGRNYFSEHEYAMRLQVFRENYQTIQRVNSEGRSYRVGMNKFGDWTKEEFKALLTYTPDERKDVKYTTLKGIKDTEVDWRGKSVNPIQDQGKCGSCYAFASTASIEHETSFFLPSLQKYSEQQIVDCSGEYGNAGCNGGLVTTTYDFLTDFPICLQKEYPYKTDQDGKCLQDECTDTDYVIREYSKVPPFSADALKETATYSVVALGIAGDSEVFQFYKSGVFDDQECGTTMNHAVAVVGYGNDDGKDFFILRNSWGTSWGEEGYMRIAPGDETTGGTCGFLQDLAHPAYRC